ncbi:hypothetical protein EOL70_11505 [Leucothrix sargassi]|nr:hypothetical protein EOL70_11505 [Leucothrix sargassi]
MKKPKSVRSLEDFGRVRLSKSFYMRDFMYSEISTFHGIPNIPDQPDVAIESCKILCEELLEPLNDTFGRISIFSGYRSPSVNQFGNENDFNCSSNEANYASHIFDYRDKNDSMGATVSLVIPWFADQLDSGKSWVDLAWWIHDHLPHCGLCFFRELAAFNISWHETNKEKTIFSYIDPKGTLTKKGMSNYDGDHSEYYSYFPKLNK